MISVARIADKLAKAKKYSKRSLIISTCVCAFPITNTFSKITVYNITNKIPYNTFSLSEYKI